MKIEQSHLAIVAALTLVACDHGSAGGAPSASSTSATAASAATAAPVGPNDGTDPHRPALSPDDMNYVDAKHGWGWSDRSFLAAKKGTGKYGWAVAECQKGLALPDLDPKAKAALLYNEGLAFEGGGDNASARDLYQQSLALRAPNDPGRPEVMACLARVGGASAPSAAPAHADECDPNAAMVHSGKCADGKCCHAAAPRSACVGAGGSYPLTPGGMCQQPWRTCQAPAACAD